MSRLFYLLIACPVLVILSIYFVSGYIADDRIDAASLDDEDTDSIWSDVCPQYTVPIDASGCIVYRSPQDICLTEFSGDQEQCVEDDTRPTTLHDCHDMYTFGYKKWAPDSVPQLTFDQYFELMCDLDDSDGLGRGWAHVCPEHILGQEDGGCGILQFERQTVCDAVFYNAAEDECIDYENRPTTPQDCQDMYEYGYMTYMRNFDHEYHESFETFASSKCDL